jgi:hypothetical protein
MGSIVELVKLGTAGLVAFLALSAYKLIAAEQRKPKADKQILRSTSIYMSFAVVSAIIGGVFSIYELRYKQPLREPAPPIPFLQTLAKFSPQWRVFPRFTVTTTDGSRSVSVSSYREADKGSIQEFFSAVDPMLKVDMGATVQPRVLLMDSPIQANVYSDAAYKKGATNADGIDGILRDRSTLDWKVFKETTSMVWNRYDRVVDIDPDIIVVHASAFWDNSEIDEKNERSRFIDFL